MNPTERLLKLYRVDEQLHSLKSRLDSAERYYKAQERKLTELEAQKSRIHDERMHASATGANFETEAKTIEDRMDVLRERMGSSTTNKEYTGFLTELNTIKIDKDEAESQALEFMSRAEELQAEIMVIDEQIVERRKVRGIALKEFEDRRDAIADRLAELEGERKLALESIPENVLAVYEKQLDWHDGEAMAAVIEQDRRNMEYVCGSCHMTIPIESLSSLLGRGDITSCPSCRCILYIESELREVFEKKAAKS